MNFEHYTDCLVGLAVTLANGVPGDAEQLHAVLVEQGVSDVGPVMGADLARVRDLGPRLRAVLTASEVREAAAVCNRLIAEVGALPRLTDHDGDPWHLHYARPGASLGERLVVETAMALAVVLRDEGLSRFRTCASPDCADVFVDASRNRSRRFCSAGVCANRTHVAAHRARRRAAGA